jgi:urease accessory protein
MSQNLLLDRRLALMQLADSFFPSGSFTLSHGLEVLVQSKQIRSIDDFQNFLKLLLYNKIGTSDLIALVHAYRASEQNNITEVRNIDLKLFAQTPIQEIREAQRKSGRALLSVACSTWDDSQLQTIRAYAETGYITCLHPIIFAIVGRAAHLTEDDTLFAFLHSFSTGLCGAAIRLGIIGHLKAQFVIKEVAADLEAIAHQAALSNLNEMQSCAPFIDIAQMTHKQLSQRLFSN